MSSRAIQSTGFREWSGLAVLALPTLFLGLDVSALYLAVPVLVTDLRAGPTDTLWIMDVYGFLIAARAALGVAGAALMPSTLALIGTLFPNPRQRGLAIGVWATLFALGMALGPILGGLLLQRFWWGSVFLIAVPIMAAVLIAGPLLLPEHRDPTAGRLDLTSVALSLLAVLPLVYAVKHGAVAGFDALTIVASGTGAVFLVVFVRRQNRISDPLLNLSLFRAPAFAAALTLLLLALIPASGSMYLVTQHLQLVEQMPPLVAGLWIGPAAVSMVAAAIGAPLLALRIRPAVIVAGTLVASAVGYLLFATADGAGSTVPVVAGFTLVYLGLGAVSALGTDLVVGAAPTDRAGSAAALSETAQNSALPREWRCSVASSAPSIARASWPSPTPDSPVQLVRAWTARVPWPLSSPPQPSTWPARPRLTVSTSSA